MTELTIAHISDIHAGSPYFVPAMMDRVVVELNELEPDIVLCTGDLTEMGFRQDYVTAKEYLDRIEAPLRRRARQPRRAQRRLRALRGAHRAALADAR